MLARSRTSVPSIDWRLPFYGALWAVNAVLLVVTIAAFFAADVGVDWDVYVNGSQGDLVYRYSPLLVPFFDLIAPIGYLGWTALHFAVLLLLPGRLALIALIMAPFWNDIYNGNTMTFVAVAAVLAVRGNRWGTLAFLTLAVLMPRPVMLPVLGYLLWTRREWVIPFAGIAAVHALAVVATGQWETWISTLVGTGLNDIGAGADLGPSRFLGLWWYPAGLAGALWLTVKGHIGWASIFATPYWLLPYGLMLLLEAVPRPSAQASRGAAQWPPEPSTAAGRAG